MKKGMQVKILAAVAVVLVVFGLVYLISQKKIKREEKETQVTKEFSIPPLLTDRKVFKITDMAKSFFKGQELGSAKEITIYVPKGVEPHYINIKKAEVGYFIELFKYREVAEGVIAHALNITSSNPRTKIETVSKVEKTVGGIVVSVEKNSFSISSLKPGQKKNTPYQIKVAPDTSFVFMDMLFSQPAEKKTSFSSLKKDQSVAVRYSKEEGGVILANKVEIINNFQLPIGQASRR